MANTQKGMLQNVLEPRVFRERVWKEKLHQHKAFDSAYIVNGALFG